ncbi:MAG: PPIC-type domain [Chthonomonadaceae bacterium]|nr:PPIC-type domain [Chthonomonadaceae bacterium]
MHAFCRSARPALCALTIALIALPGCQGRKVVARVNSETINEDDFTNRALHVTSLNPQAGLDAGGVTLVNMIKENLLLQLAKSKGVTVTDDQMGKYVSGIEKLQPQILEGVRSGKITQEDLNREYRMEMLLFAIGTDNAKATQQELQAAYDKHQTDLSIKGNYTLKILPLQDPAKAELALAELKKSGDFKKAAAAGGLPPEIAATMGKETTIPSTQTPPDLRNAIETLKPTDFVAKPVPLQNTQNGQMFYIVAQLVDKTKDRVLSMDEAHVLVERFALADKFPQWGQHADTAMNDFITQSKDNIQIDIDRYKALKDQFILPKPKTAVPAQAPSGSAPAPGAAAPSSAPAPAPGGKM